MGSGFSIVSHRSIVGGNGRTKFTRHLMTICKVENMLNFIVFVVWIFVTFGMWMHYFQMLICVLFKLDNFM